MTTETLSPIEMNAIERKIIAAERRNKFPDAIESVEIPVRQARALFEAAREPKYLESDEIEGF